MPSRKGLGFPFAAALVTGGFKGPGGSTELLPPSRLIKIDDGCRADSIRPISSTTGVGPPPFPRLVIRDGSRAIACAVFVASPSPRYQQLFDAAARLLTGSPDTMS